MTLTVKHSVITGAPADPKALVDGPAWDASHQVTGNLDVANFNSGSNASFTSVWRGDATWYDLPYVTLEMFGGGVGVADNSAALNAAVAFIGFRATRRIVLNAGVYYFTTKPANFTTTVILEGQCPSQTNLVRSYSAGSSTEGFITWSGSAANGSRLRNLQINADNGTSNGCLLSITTGTNVVAGFQAIENVVFSHIGTGDYVNCLNVDGSANQTVGGQGIRDLIIENSFFFRGNAGTESLRFINATNHSVAGCWANGTCTITGGGTALTNTTLGKFDMNCISNVFVSNATLVSFYGNYNSLIFSTGTTNCFNGASYPVGSFTDGGTNNANAGNIVIGASSGANGASGLVPAPLAGQQTAFLKGSGLWANIFASDVSGTTTNDNAAAGKIGEYIESDIVVGSAVALTNTSITNITSISLTAGDWDVWGIVATTQAGGPTTTALVGTINTVSGTLPTDLQNKGATNFWRGSTTSTLILPVGFRRYSFASTTTVYLIINPFFTGGTSLSGYGTIAARRVR